MGLKKETFEELLRKANIPCQYFCRKSFATWDVLLPTEEQAAKLAANNITTKYFRLEPEYRGTRKLRVTICNVPAHITGEVLAAYLSSYGQVEEYNLLRSPAGTAYGDYAFRLCLTRDGFKAIPETLISGGRQMIVMVEGRRPRCWSCKQIGHISKFCPEKTENAVAAAAAAAATTTTASTATISKTAEAQDPSQGQPKTNDKEGWSEVTRRRRGSTKQGEKNLISSPPQNQTKAPEPVAAATTAEQATTPTTKKGPQTPTTTTKTTVTSTTPVSPTLAKKKKEKKQGRPWKHGNDYKLEKKKRQRGGCCQKSVCRTFLHRRPIRRPFKCTSPKAASSPTSSNADTTPGSFSATLLTTTSPTNSANVPSSILHSSEGSPWVATTPTIFTTPITTTTTTTTSPTNRNTPTSSPVEKQSPTSNCAYKASTIPRKTIPPKITQVTLITIPESNLFPRTLFGTDSHPNKPPDYII